MPNLTIGTRVMRSGYPFTVKEVYTFDSAESVILRGESGEVDVPMYEAVTYPRA